MKPKPIKRNNITHFTPEEKFLLEKEDFVVRTNRYGIGRATYSLLNPTGGKALFKDDGGHEAFIEIIGREQSLYSEYSGKFIAKFWARNCGTHWDKMWAFNEIRDFDFAEMKRICDKSSLENLPEKTKLQLLEAKFLPQFSNTPVEEWEKECTRLYTEAEANKKISTIKKVGYLIKYPTGTEKFEEQYIPGWAKKFLPIEALIKAESPYGEVEISPLQWEEEKVEKEVVVLPPKPEPIQGFNIDKSSQVALICNEVFGTNWHWFDVDCHSIRNGCKTFEWENKVLRIFPDKYEVYEIVLMSKEEIISSLRQEICELQKQ